MLFFSWKKRAPPKQEHFRIQLIEKKIDTIADLLWEPRASEVGFSARSQILGSPQRDNVT